MKNYIEENASSMFKLEDVAAHVGISVSRAVHLFKEAFGTTIMQYTMDVRLSMAKERIVFSPSPGGCRRNLRLCELHLFSPRFPFPIRRFAQAIPHVQQDLQLMAIPAR